MTDFLHFTYLSILKTILLPLALSLFITYVLIKLNKTKLFYLLIGIETIVILIRLYSTISMSIIMYMQIKEFIILTHMFMILLIFLLIPILSVIFRIILKRIL